jgi:PAS domain S-box-containing protein
MPAHDDDLLNHERLQAAVAAAGIGTWDLNPQTGDLRWSDHCKQLLGVPPAAEVTLPLFLERVHPDDRAATEAAVVHVLSGVGTGVLDIEYRTPDGGPADQPRWLRATGQAYFDDARRPTRLVGTVTDITPGKETALRFQLLAENAPLMIATTDGAGQFQYLNQRLMDYTGLPLEQMTEQWGTLVHPDDLPRVGALWATALQTGQPYEAEYRLRRHDGQYRWMLSYTRPVPGPDGRPAAWVSSNLDIHQRKTTERNLEQLLASDVIGILFWDLDSTAVPDANDAYLRLIGYSRDDLQAGRIDWHAITPPEYHALDEQAIAELRRTGTHRPFEKELLRPDGTRVPVLLGGSLTEPGTHKGVSFCLDITPQKEALRAASAREREFTTLANTVAQLSWMAEADGHIFWYNDRWYDYTGTDLAEMQGWGWQKVHHPDHIERVLEQVKAAWPAGEPFELTFPLRSKEGEFRWFLTRVVPILEEQGHVQRWFGTNTDVTEMRRLQDQLERSYQDLETKVTFRNLQLEREVRELRAQLGK